jgi:DNA-binding transcriptional LysR family regulator
MDRLRAVELFLRLVETGSFTAGATALRMSRSGRRPRSRRSRRMERFLVEAEKAARLAGR